MNLCQRLTVWRRGWCISRGHQMADWSPICITYISPDGSEIVERAWRCSVHDQKPAKVRS